MRRTGCYLLTSVCIQICLKALAMKISLIILTNSLLLHCLYLLAGLYLVHAIIDKRSNTNCSIVLEDFFGDKPSENNATNAPIDEVNSVLDSNTTNICIATYVGENTTLITKRDSVVSYHLSNPGTSLVLLNKSELLSKIVLFCDPECEPKFNSGIIYTSSRSLKDTNSFLEYYTNYRCIDLQPNVPSTTLVFYLRLLSLILMCVASVTCAFYLIKFTLDKSLWTLPGFSLLSLCIADLILYSCFFAMKIAPLNENTSFVCGLYLYTTLSNWFWVNVLTFDLWKSIRMAIVKFRRTSTKYFVLRFIYYSLYAWGMPSIITFFVVHPFSSDQRLVYHSGFSEQGKNMAELYIAVPLMLLQITNFALFYSSVYMVFKDSQCRSQPGQSEVSNIKRNFQFFFRMSFVMAVIWIFGLVGYFAKIELLMYSYIYAKILEAPYIVWNLSRCGRTKDCCRPCCCSCSSKTESEITIT